MDHDHHGGHSDHSQHSGHSMMETSDGSMTASPMDSMDMGMHGDGHGDGGGMSMYFYAGCDVTILFKSWSVNSVGGLIGSMIGVFFLAIIYEALKYFREYLFRRSFATVNYSTVTVPNETSKVQGVQRSIKKRLLSPGHFAQTGLHVVQVCLSYFLMLIFMTYNVWLCLAVVLGAGVGFFMFGWKKTIVVDITEHCH